jgi:probable rRNA maturation factor
MILLDPDLDPDPALFPGASSPDPQVAGRTMRLPSTRTLARFLSEAQAAVRLKGQVCVLLTSDAAMRRLNRQFRGKNKATDVLSFPAADAVRADTAGDVAISVDTARRQAAEHGHSLGAEIKILVLHGLLHLAGFDHEADSGEMARREIGLRERLRLPVGLIERAGGQPALRAKGRTKDEARRQSRFPAGMTERKATAGPSTAVAAATFAQDDKREQKPRSAQDDKREQKPRSAPGDKREQTRRSAQDDKRKQTRRSAEDDKRKQTRRFAEDDTAALSGRRARRRRA